MKRLIGQGVTDSSGVATIPYVGTGAGSLQIVAECEGEDGILQSEIFVTLDCQYIDYGTINNHQTWRNESSSTFIRTDTACTIKTSTSMFPRIEKTITGDFEAVFYASMTNPIRLACYKASDTNNQILWILNQSDEVLFRIRRIGTEWTVQHSTDNGATWSANYTKLSGTITDEDVYFGFVISTNTERSITYHDLRVYPI